MIPLLLIPTNPEQKSKFLQLYEQYRDLMFYMAFGILKNKELAEEAVQDALIKILLHIEDIEEIGCHKTRNWAVYIIRRVSLNKLEYEKRREHEPDEIFEIKDFDNITLEDQAIRYLEIDKIVDAIRHVEETCNIIVLKYYFGYSDSMLAKHYDISAEAARKRIERCKKKLKQFLGLKGGGGTAMKEFNDRIFELMLEEASEKYVDEIAAEYPSPEELRGKYTFSSNFEKWAEEIIKNEEKRLRRIERKKKWQGVRNFGQKIALCICCLFAIFLVLAFTVPPIRMAVLNFITKTHNEYNEVDLTDNPNTMYDDTIDNINMPEEFEIIGTTESENYLIVTYQNNAGETIHLERYATTNMIVDNEENGFTKIVIGEKEGYISSKNGKTTILFHDEAYGYTLISDIDQNRLIEIAKGIMN